MIFSFFRIVKVLTPSFCLFWWPKSQRLIQFLIFCCMCIYIFINRGVEEDEGFGRNYLNKATKLSTWLPTKQTQKAGKRLNTGKFETNFFVHPLAPRSLLAAVAAAAAAVAFAVSLLGRLPLRLTSSRTTGPVRIRSNIPSGRNPCKRHSGYL